MTRWLLLLFGALPLFALVVERVLPGSPAVSLLDAWFSLHCHQDPARTLHVGGQAFPVCARCTGIYLGLLAGAIVPYPPGSRRTWLTLLGIAAAALLLDVGTQAAGLRVSSLPTRLVTGLLLAYPAARLATETLPAPAPRA